MNLKLNIFGVPVRKNFISRARNQNQCWLLWPFQFQSTPVLNNMNSVCKISPTGPVIKHLFGMSFRSPLDDKFLRTTIIAYTSISKPKKINKKNCGLRKELLNMPGIKTKQSVLSHDISAYCLDP
jgi:hypothetical protein